MPIVRVLENEYFDASLRRIKRACEKAGLVTELRRREFEFKDTRTLRQPSPMRMKPTRSWTHEAVIEDFRSLLAGSHALREGATDGFTVIHDVWFRKGVPPDLWRTADTVNGFDLAVLDECGVTWLLGWNRQSQELVLFGAEPAEGLALTENVIDRYRKRIGGGS